VTLLFRPCVLPAGVPNPNLGLFYAEGGKKFTTTDGRGAKIKSRMCLQLSALAASVDHGIVTGHGYGMPSGACGSASLPSILLSCPAAYCSRTVPGSPLSNSISNSSTATAVAACSTVPRGWARRSRRADHLRQPQNASSRDGLSAVCQSESAGRAPFRLAACPSAGACGELLADVRPVVERAGIEVRAVRPHERPGLRIQDDAIEHPKLLKRAEQWTVEHRPKVDVLLRAVTEAHGELVRPNHLEADDAKDGVAHYLSGSILTGG
jgi:hypothetical protein